MNLTRINEAAGLTYITYAKKHYPYCGRDRAPTADPLGVDAIGRWSRWTRLELETGRFYFPFVLLFAAGLTYEIVARRSDNSTYRIAVGIAVVSALLLVWVNGAVGIIGEPGGPNLMYVGVLAVGFIGALLARFRPHGMARALFTMAIAQMSVPVIALVTAKPQMTMEPPGVVGVFGLNAVFAMLFVGSALLFRRASATNSRSDRRLSEMGTGV